MLTYHIDRTGKIPLYDALYRAIRDDILAGRLAPGERLPSKRALAEHLHISKVTVENAYGQLFSEGYIYSRSRSGYYVEHGDWGTEGTVSPAFAAGVPAEQKQMPQEEPLVIDFTRGSIDTERFPFSVWSRLMRSVIADEGEHLLRAAPPGGVPVLREAIAAYLYRMRGLSVLPEQVIVGAGSEYLCQLLLQLLGREKCYATETPGYPKMRRLFAANGVRQVAVGMDASGVSPTLLAESGADVLHFSPSHHFPTGIITSAARRRELLTWAYAGKARYLIEDDYDSEFRFVGKPVPTLMSADSDGRVIYLNTFSKSIAPSIRISYMVLPPRLLEKFTETLGFYASTVPAFEQYTLARFLNEGYFEKHLARMKKYYRQTRDFLTAAIAASPYADRITVREEDAGLHFLLQVRTALSDAALKAWCRERLIGVNCLSEYDAVPAANAALHTLVIHYSGVTRQQIEEAAKRLREC